MCETSKEKGKFFISNNLTKKNIQQKSNLLLDSYWVSISLSEKTIWGEL